MCYSRQQNRRKKVFLYYQICVRSSSGNSSNSYSYSSYSSYSYHSSISSCFSYGSSSRWIRTIGVAQRVFGFGSAGSQSPALLVLPVDYNLLERTCVRPHLPSPLPPPGADSDKRKGAANVWIGDIEQFTHTQKKLPQLQLHPQSKPPKPPPPSAPLSLIACFLHLPPPPPSAFLPPSEPLNQHR